MSGIYGEILTFPQESGPDARQGGSLDDLITAFDSDHPGELTTMVGQPMQGNWTLHVSDRAGIDTGTLLKWEISIESTSLDRAATPQYAASDTQTSNKPVHS